MTRQDFSILIERAEQIVAAIDKWGGIDTVSNCIDLIGECLEKIDATKDVLIQLEKMKGKAFVFKAVLTIDEAADYLCVHRNTVYKLIKSHGLNTFNPPSTKMLILTEDLVEWCKQYPNGVAVAEVKSGISGTQKKKGVKP